MSAPLFRVDSLESRRLLSGNVLAKIVGGKLLLRGDNQDNALIVNDDGLATGQLRVSVGSGTTVNGSADPLVVSGVTRGIAARLQDGNDTITLDGIAVSGKKGLSINGSGGNDTIKVLNSTVTGRTHLRAGGGDDAIDLTGSTFNGRFDLNASGGQNTIVLGNAVFSGKKKIHVHKKRDSVIEGAVLNFTFDFTNGDQGFQAGFADYPTGEEAFYELKSGVQQLPVEVGAGTGFYLSGNNHSDDLFMFIERALTAAEGIKANQSYTVSFEIKFASDAPTGCTGIGGAPGESVYLKAGATGTNPEAVDEGGVMVLNVDKGQQSEGGTAASVAGDIANGIACEVAMQSPTLPYASVTRTHTHTATVKADAAGNLYLIVGTDSGFEGTTNIYFQQIKVALTPVSSGPTKPGNGHSDGKSDGDSDGKSDGDSDGNGDCGCPDDGNTDGNSDGDTDGDSDGDTDGKSDGDSDGTSDGDSDGGDDDDDKKEKKDRKDKKPKKDKKTKKAKSRKD